MKLIHSLEQLAMEFGVIEVRLASYNNWSGRDPNAGHIPGSDGAGTSAKLAMWVATCGGATGIGATARDALDALLDHVKNLAAYRERER